MSMRAASLTAVVLMLGTMGWAMEVAHPVLFAQEPVVVWTSPGEGHPSLLFCGEQVIATWTKHREEGRVRWEANLPSDAPLGVWTVEVKDACYSFLRIPMEWAILEVTGVAGSEVEAPGVQVIPGEDGTTALIGPAGSWRVSITLPGWEEARVEELALSPGERRLLLLGRVELTPSTPVALPGTTIQVTVTILTPVDLPRLAGSLVLPPGWSAEPTTCETCPLRFEEPVPAGHLATRAWLVHIPLDAGGSYTIELALPGLGLTGRATVEVRNRLPIEVVVTHWDVENDILDLALSGKITYEQLLWAASLVGQEVPFSGQRMTQTRLEALAEKWLASGAP